MRYKGRRPNSIVPVAVRRHILKEYWHAEQVHASRRPTLESAWMYPERGFACGTPAIGRPGRVARRVGQFQLHREGAIQTALHQRHGDNMVSAVEAGPLLREHTHLRWDTGITVWIVVVIQPDRINGGDATLDHIQHFPALELAGVVAPVAQQDHRPAGHSTGACERAASRGLGRRPGRRRG